MHDFNQLPTWSLFFLIVSNCDISLFLTLLNGRRKKSMNMFTVMITAPKTLAQNPVRLYQVNNIIA